tara:strand:- start:308 stop:697 length:390 start_codon:yes stop_codon:yes gene_type:complete
MKDINIFDLIIKLNKRKLKLVMEDRKKFNGFEYGIQNHAEIINFINNADNDPWDVVIPGYKKKIDVNKIFKSNYIIGVLFLENNNSKIFMKVDHPGYNKTKAITDIKKFITNYYKKWKLKYCWIEYMGV